MTTALALAVGALIANGLFDLVYKRAARVGVPAHSLVMAQGWCFAVFLVVFGLATGTLQWTPSASWGAVAGLFLFLGLYNFARSLKSGSLSINAPIFRMNFVVTAGLAVVLLDESVTLIHGVGLVCAVAAAWLLLGGAAAGSSTPPVSNDSLLRVAVATAAMGIANLVYKIGMEAGATAAGLLTVQAAVFVSLATLRVRLIEGRIAPTPRIMAFGAIAAVLLALALILLLEALARGEASVLVPIAQMGFVVSAAAGFLVLGERASRRALAGLVAAVAALASFMLR